MTDNHDSNPNAINATKVIKEFIMKRREERFLKRVFVRNDIRLTTDPYGVASKLIKDGFIVLEDGHINITQKGKDEVFLNQL